MPITPPETHSLPSLTPDEYAALLKDTLRALGDLGAYFIRVDKHDGAIIFRQFDQIMSLCGGNVPNTMAPSQLPTQERLERVERLLAHVNKTLLAGRTLVIRTEAIESVCHSAVPDDL